MLIIGAGVLAIASGGVVLIQAGYNSNPTEAAASRPGNRVAAAWPVPADQRARAEAADLDMGPMGTADHYHPQLAIEVDGEPVRVPAGIGIDPPTGQMSAVHTHTADGVVHIEAATTGQGFTLGQLFSQWGVELGRASLGDLRGGELTVVTNGERYTKAPATLLFAAEQKITVSYTSAQATPESASSSGAAQ